MLALLLDENLSDEIALHVTAKRPDIPIFSAHTWEGGQLRSVDDETVLRVLASSQLTLVTCDVTTIPLLLVRLANEEFIHGGVVFVHNNTIRSNDCGSLVRALIQLYDLEHAAEWRDRLYFLPAPL